MDSMKDHLRGIDATKHEGVRSAAYRFPSELPYEPKAERKSQDAKGAVGTEWKIVVSRERSNDSLKLTTGGVKYSFGELPPW